MVTLSEYQVTVSYATVIGTETRARAVEPVETLEEI
jgi:hypothetical protein